MSLDYEELARVLKEDAQDFKLPERRDSKIG